MPVAKTDVFEADLAALAEVAKALAHPARLAILQTLAQRGTCICGQIVDVLPLAQATVSQHLKALKASGLVQGEVDGPRSCYCVDAAALREAAQAMADFFAGLESSAGDCCGPTCS